MPEEKKYKKYKDVLNLEMTQEEHDEFLEKLRKLLHEIGPTSETLISKGLCTFYRMDGTEIK